MAELCPREHLPCEVAQKETSKEGVEAEIEPMPVGRDDEDSSQRTYLDSTSRLRTINQSQHDVVLEPLLDLEVPAADTFSRGLHCLKVVDVNRSHAIELLWLLLSLGTITLASGD